MYTFQEPHNSARSQNSRTFSGHLGPSKTRRNFAASRRPPIKRTMNDVDDTSSVAESVGAFLARGGGGRSDLHAVQRLMADWGSESVMSLSMDKPVPKPHRKGRFFSRKPTNEESTASITASSSTSSSLSSKSPTLQQRRKMRAPSPAPARAPLHARPKGPSRDRTRGNRQSNPKSTTIRSRSTPPPSPPLHTRRPVARPNPLPNPASSHSPPLSSPPPPPSPPSFLETSIDLDTSLESTDSSVFSMLTFTEIWCGEDEYETVYGAV